MEYNQIRSTICLTWFDLPSLLYKKIVPIYPVHPVFKRWDNKEESHEFLSEKAFKLVIDEDGSGRTFRIYEKYFWDLHYDIYDLALDIRKYWEAQLNGYVPDERCINPDDVMLPSSLKECGHNFNYNLIRNCIVYLKLKYPNCSRDTLLIWSMLYLFDWTTPQGVPIRNLFLGYCREIGVKNPSVILDPFVYKLPFLQKEEHEQDNLVVHISNLEILDPHDIYFRQLIEIKQDKEATDKLHKFYNFFESNFNGKSKEFVEDQFGTLYNGYKKELEKHGVETKLGVREQIFNSKDLKQFLGASFLAALTNQYEVAALSSLAGISFELGKVVTKIKRSKYELDWMKNNHDVSYLYYLEEKLSG